MILFFICLLFFFVEIVDKALLDTPEDEIDVTKLCMRDLILLAEHRERISVCIMHYPMTASILMDL